MVTRKKVAIVVVTLFLTGGLLKIVDSEIKPISPMIFSRLHFFEENMVDAQVVTGEDINKYTRINWVDSYNYKMEREYPERGLTFSYRYEDGNITRVVVDILDLDNKKKRSLYFPRKEVLEIRWLDNGLLLHGVETFPAGLKEINRDYFYDLENREKRPIKNDGQEKCTGKDKKLFSHPKNRDYLLETYCLSVRYTPGGNELCVQWGVSLTTSTKSTKILSFYHSPVRQELHIGWDDDNFYVKTGKSGVDWGSDEQKLESERMNVDEADSSDRMYIIPLENLRSL